MMIGNAHFLRAFNLLPRDFICKHNQQALVSLRSKRSAPPDFVHEFMHPAFRRERFRMEVPPRCWRHSGGGAKTG